MKNAQTAAITMNTNKLLELSEEQRDCLQEVVNVAMGQAGDSLARFLEVFIQLSVPRIRQVHRDQLNQQLETLLGGNSTLVSGVSQGFYQLSGSRGLRGEAIVLFTDRSFRALADLLAYDETLNMESETELLLDVANILSGACLSGIAEQFGTEMGFSTPAILGQRISIAVMLENEKAEWDHALLVEICYTLENRSFSCTLFLLMPGESILMVKRALDHLLELL